MPDSETNGSASAPPNPFARTLPIAVTAHLLGVNRKVEVSETSAAGDVEDPNLLRVSKVLIECPEYDAIKTLLNKLKSQLRRMSMPGGQKLFRPGTYPVLMARIPEAIKLLKAAQQELTILRDKFLAVYEQRRDEAMVKLGSLANAADYPPLGKVKEHFGLEFDFIQLGVPEGLKQIDPAVFGEEYEKMKMKLRQAGDDAVAAMTQLVQEAVTGFCDALKPGENGKRKQLAGPMKALREVLTDYESAFPGTGLEAFSKKLQGILAGVNPDSLRESPNTRRLVEKRMAEVKAAIDKTVVAAASRKFRSDDE